MGDLEVCAGAWRSGREQSATMGGGSLSFQSVPTRWRLVRTVTSGVVRSPSALEQAAGELLKPGVGYLAVRARARRSGRGQFATVGEDPESFSPIR